MRWPSPVHHHNRALRRQNRFRRRPPPKRRTPGRPCGTARRPRTEPPIDAESDPATSLTERKQSEKPEPELADREEESDEDGQQKGPITDADDLSADDDETGTDDESSPVTDQRQSLRKKRRS